MEVEADEVRRPSQCARVLNYRIPSCIGLRVGHEDNALGGRSVLKDGGNMRRSDFGSSSRQPKCERKLGTTSDTFIRKDECILQRPALEDEA